MILVYLKDIISTLLPLILLNFIFQYFYQTNIYKIGVWWFKNHSEVGHVGLSFMGLFLACLMVWVSFGSIIRDASLAINGETHEMVYAGEIEKNTSFLYHAKNLELPAMESLNTFGKNLSFNNIYRTVTFKRDKKTDRLGVIDQFNDFSMRNVTRTIFFIIAYAPFLLVIAHTFALEPQIALVDSSLSWGESFWKVYSPYGLTIKNVLVTSSLCIFGPMVLFTIIPKTDFKAPTPVFKERTIPLPSYIKPGYTLSALPVSSYKIIIDSIGNGYDTDTGKRVITFKFDDGFKLPVYVSYLFQTESSPDLYKIARQHINSRSPIKVEITDSLGLKMINEN